MNSMLEYKGYHASVEFDAEDNLFIGEVFGINDSLNFHGTSVTELKEMFPDIPFRFSDPLSLSVACHIGPGALAVGCTRILK